MALSFNYPMLWDEYYHFGLIQFYGQHISPIIANQPTSLDLYGNVARSPKYFYHYLLSFPYRGISLITANEAAQVIALRFINIGIFAAALVVFRKAMLRVTASKPLVHFALLIIALLPLTSLMAAHINYDNAQFLITALLLLWTIQYAQAKQPNVKLLLLIVSVSAIGALIKYTIFPIVVALGLYLMVHTLRNYGRDSLSMVMASWRDAARNTKIALLVLLVVSVGLAGERFVGNVVQYGRIDPVCNQVISTERCLSFSPFKQEHTLGNTQNKTMTDYPWHEPLHFTYTYFLRDNYKQYFTSGTQLAYEYFTVPEPLKIPFTVVAVAAVISIVCVIISTKYLIRMPSVQISLLAALFLTAALWIIDYEKYIRTGAPLAIQGRYLLPLFPMVLLIALLGVRHAIPWRSVKLVGATVVLIGLLWGGGLAAHIYHSKRDWYWQNNFVVTTNESISDSLHKILR